MRPAPILFATILLVACASPARQQAAPASFDLGTVAVAWKPASPAVRGVGVFAPSWLATSALQYRLLYADPLRRQNYGESRWAAPPAELIERALNRQTAAGGGCPLRLDLDELVQVFDTPQTSRVLLELRASLVTPDRGAVLARKAFAATQPAPTADARGAVAATAAAVQTLGGELGTWLAQVARDNPAVAEQCRGG